MQASHTKAAPGLWGALFLSFFLFFSFFVYQKWHYLLSALGVALFCSICSCPECWEQTSRLALFLVQRSCLRTSGTARYPTSFFPPSPSSNYPCFKNSHKGLPFCKISCTPFSQAYHSPPPPPLIFYHALAASGTVPFFCLFTICLPHLWNSLWEIVLSADTDILIFGNSVCKRFTFMKSVFR